MIHTQYGQVMELRHSEFGKGLAEVLVRTEDGGEALAIADLEQWPSIRSGCRVVLNVTAQRLKLGSGGYHFIMAVEEPKSCSEAECQSIQAEGEREPSPSSSGHIMKLRYTSNQRAVMAVEEPESPFHEQFLSQQELNGMPVLIGEIHSMLPIAMCWIQYRAQKAAHTSAPPKVAYVMSEGGALPLAYSKHVARLCGLRWLDATITYGHSYGGSFEAVNKYTALITAKHVAQCELAIVTMGPGIVGTGTHLGHSATEIGEISNAVRALGGLPILMPRISEADPRERHRGLSHHLISVLQTVAQQPAIVPLPRISGALGKRIEQQASKIPSHHELEWMEGLESARYSEAIDAALAAYPAPITTMGRGVMEDRAFFLGICAAAEAAWQRYKP